MSIFRLYPGFKMSFEDNIVRKNLFLSAFFCWESRLSLLEMDQKFEFGGLIGYGNSYLDSVFFIITRKCLDYMQYYMMLPEQCEHIVVKVQATVT